MDGWPDEELFCVGDATIGIERCRKDNCPRTPNTGQEDFDGNGQGDACQRDIDGDGVYNRFDNCPYIANGNQVPHLFQFCHKYFRKLNGLTMINTFIICSNFRISLKHAR